MSVFQTRRALAGLACVLFAAAAPALAQQQPAGPKQLRPAAEVEQQPTRPAAPGDIRVNRLDAPGESSAGVLGEQDGGLPLTLWEGSDRGVIEALFARLPAHYRSPVARDLARRLLLSGGQMPEARPGDAGLLARRIELVLTLGDAEGAVALAQAAGGAAPPPEVAEPLTEALLALGENDRACGTVEGQIRLGGRGYWQRASVFCDILAKRLDAADLTLSLLAEASDPDPLFRTLANALLDGADVNIEATPEMSALHLSMALGGKTTVIRNSDVMPPHLARRLLTASAADSDSRIAAGVRATRHTGMSPAVVMLLFGGSAGENGAPFRNPTVTAMTAQTAAVRAEAVNDLWNSATGPGDKPVAAAFAEGFLKKLKPDAGSYFIAPAAFRIALLNGETKQAEIWLTALRRASASGVLPGEALQAAHPLARLAGMQGADDRVLDLWLDGELAEGGDTARAYMVLLALDALGDPADAEVWARLLEAVPAAAQQTAPDFALWRQLVVASGANRIGETLQAALTIIGADGPQGLDPVTLATVAGALRRAGLAAEARQLILEAVIGQGG